MTKASKKGGSNNKSPVQNFSLRNIKPITYNQERAFDAYDSGKHLLLHGLAGTGKSFCGLFLALEDVLRNKEFSQVKIIRSTVPTRDMGFYPGSPKEKAKVYEEPYYEICANLFGRGDAYDVLKNKGVVEFVPTAHIRGMTFRNSVIVVDEVQNMSGGECHTIMTRLGENCKIIFAGDFRQTDLKEKERGGFHNFMKVISKMPSFEFVEFGVEDIVRSGIVKEYLILMQEMGIQFL